MLLNALVHLCHTVDLLIGIPLLVVIVSGFVVGLLTPTVQKYKEDTVELELVEYFKELQTTYQLEVPMDTEIEQAYQVIHQAAEVVELGVEVGVVELPDPWDTPNYSVVEPVHRTVHQHWTSPQLLLPPPSIKWLKLKQLKQLAKEAGIKGYYKLRKAQLVTALQSAGVA